MESIEIKMKWEFEMILKLNERIKSDQEWILKTPQKNMKRKRNPYIPVLDIYIYIHIHQFNQLSTPLKCLGRFTESLPQPECHLGNLAGTWWFYTHKVCLKSWKVCFFGHPKCLHRQTLSTRRRAEGRAIRFAKGDAYGTDPNARNYRCMSFTQN